MRKDTKRILHHIFAALFLASSMYLAYSFLDELFIVENDIFEYHEPTSEDFLPRTYPLPDNLNVEDRVGFDDPNDYSIPPVTEEELTEQ